MGSMMNPFDPGYFQSHELRQFGFARVGEGCAVSRNATILGLENITLDDRIRIDGYCTIIATAGPIRIGKSVHICSSCVLGGRGGIDIAEFSSLSHGVKLLSAVDDFSGDRMTNSTLPDYVVRVQAAPIRIGPFSPLGSSAVVLPGTTIGEGTAVHTMSVVAQSLPPWTICAGNPAVPIRQRSRNLLRHAAQLDRREAD